jgi:ribonuclease HI
MRRISVYGCIELVRKQMEGTFRVKKPSLKGYHDEAMSLRGDFESFRIHCVDKSLNERASQLARKSMNAAVGGGDGGDVLVRSAPPKDGEDGRDGRSRKSPDAPPRLAVGSDHNIMDFESILDAVLGYSAPKDDEDGNGRSRKSPDAPRLTVGSDHIKNSESISPERTYVLRFDGGSRGNPGRAGAGMVLYDGGDGAEVWCGSQYLGECYTNNQAEYRGLITGLRCAMSLGVRNIVVQGDSQLILRQLDGQYKVKSPTLMAYYQEAKSLVPEFASFQTSHIERARNARADELANLAMDNRSSMGFEVKR